ncbi:MAG TPA: AAA family ATPase [Planctomicrobium sp.]|nr:AAA family ATPase [Planctomicrobium sp.]
MITQNGAPRRNGHSPPDQGLLARENLWSLHAEHQVLACRIRFGCRSDDLDSSMFSVPANRQIFDACDDLEVVGLTPTNGHIYQILSKVVGYDLSSIESSLNDISQEHVVAEMYDVYVKQVRDNAERFRLEQHFSEGLMRLRSGASVAELQEHANLLAVVSDSREEIKFFSGPALAQLDTTLTYLVDDVIVQGQPLLLAGTKKTLKTNISIDLTISLATGESFLGQYHVAKPIRAGLMSAESGAATIKETAHRVAMSKGLSGVQDCPDALFAFSTPLVNTAKECDRFRRIIEDNELQFLNIDPTYLTFIIGDDGKNLFRMGELLSPLSRIGERTGCTICLSHHSRKGTGKEGKPLELGDESYSGFSEWARQWIYLSRREAYNENLPGSHRLWFKWGGSAGHAGLVGLDIEEGSRKDAWGRRWDVRVNAIRLLLAESQQQGTTLQSLKQELRQWRASQKKQAPSSDGIVAYAFT